MMMTMVMVMMVMMATTSLRHVAEEPAMVVTSSCRAGNAGDDGSDGHDTFTSRRRGARDAGDVVVSCW